jgi:hypothetical protein
MERHGNGKNGFESASAAKIGNKVSFYFTNFPDFMSVVQLRHFFEVCGILLDVYIARKRNYRGQVYGFLRFLNVKNTDKLAIALKNVWIGQCRIWAREARFDRFASVSSGDGVRKRKDLEVLPVVRVTGKGIKNVRVGRKEEGKIGDGEKSKNEVKVEIRAGGEERKTKVRRVGEEAAGEKVVTVEEGVEGVVSVTAVVNGQKYIKTEKNMQHVGHRHDISQHAKQEREVTRFILSYTSMEEDRNWADKGMVATVFRGDSTLALQQRIEDAGFNTVVVTPMGGIVFFYIILVERTFGMFSIMQFIFSVCYFIIYISGRWKMLDMNGGHGFVSTVFPYKLRMLPFSNYVSWT